MRTRWSHAIIMCHNSQQIWTLMTCFRRIVSRLVHIPQVLHSATTHSLMTHSPMTHSPMTHSLMTHSGWTRCWLAPSTLTSPAADVKVPKLTCWAFIATDVRCGVSLWRNCCSLELRLSQGATPSVYVQLTPMTLHGTPSLSSEIVGNNRIDFSFWILNSINLRFKTHH